MKRDMDLIRLLLLQIEGEEQPELQKYDQPTRVEHATLLIEEGLAEGLVQRDHRNVPIGTVIQRLTWKGHDFLDAARDNTIWNKAKEKVFKPGASWTFGILVEWLKAEAKKRLGL